MALLFQDSLKKSYYTTSSSCSNLFCWLLLLTGLTLPFVLVFSTNDFWQTRGVYQEQPVVLDRKELVLFAHLSDGTSLVFSSQGPVNEIFFENTAGMALSSSPRDSNFDGKPDWYDYNITLYTPPSAVRNLRALVLFDYSLQERVRLDMVVMAYLDVDTPAGASFVFTDGSLRLKQKQGILPGSITRTVYNKTLWTVGTANEMSLPLIMQRYNDRNETAEYQYGAPLVLPGGNSHTVQLNMKIRVPTHEDVVYHRPLLESLKFAWVQYLGLLLPIGALLYWFAGFVYSSQILESKVVYERERFEAY